MIFSVQRFLEDHFERRGLEDVDQYAVRVANVFDRVGPNASDQAVAREIGRVRTAFFRRNAGLDRKIFEAQLAAALQRRFQKKTNDPRYRAFERGIAPARTRLRKRRRSVAGLLLEFKRAIESRAVDAFWRSRKNHRLRSRPEKIAQALLATFAKGVVGDDGLVLREIASGIGFVDVGISFGNTLHLVELKVLTGKLTGANQLAQYMRTEGRHEGWLVLIDARLDGSRPAVPTGIVVRGGRVLTVVVDIHPAAPHAA
jgi:hypothetical protein